MAMHARGLFPSAHEIQFERRIIRDETSERERERALRNRDTRDAAIEREVAIMEATVRRLRAAVDAERPEDTDDASSECHDH